MTAPNYTDFSQEYKWIPQTDVPAITRRNMGIFAMVMNSLGVPDKLAEFAYAVFVTGNWDSTNDYDEMTIMRMTKTLGADLPSQTKLYNRLKEKSGKFFKWQEKQKFVIIDRVLLHEHTTHHKTKAKYKFVIYKMIEKLFVLPIEMPAAAVRRAVDKALKSYPTVPITQRKTKRKKPEATARAAVRGAEETIQLTGSIEAANLYLEEAAKSGSVKVLIMDLSTQS